MDLDSGVQLLDLRACGLCSVYSQVFLGQEKLSSKICLSRHLVIDNSKGANASEDEVLRNLIAQGLHSDDEDIGISDLLLGLHAPQADLTIVQGDLVW